MYVRSNTLKEEMAEILEDHFENNQNPHETIHQICMLLIREADLRAAPGIQGQTKH